MLGSVCVHTLYVGVCVLAMGLDKGMIKPILVL